MKILGLSTIDINCLKGAMLINENDAQYMCSGIGFSLDTHEVMIDLMDSDGMYYGTIPFTAATNWSIQFNTTKIY
jgi:hypothetical protein